MTFMTLSEVAAQNHLGRVGARPSLPEYLRKVWQRREFIVLLARYRIQSENERNRLGMLWVLLRPTLSAGVYGLVFGFILAGARPKDFIAFVVIGVFLMEFFNSSMTAGAKAIISNASLVQSLPFPRMVLPVSIVFQNLLNFVPTLALMCAISLFGGATLDVSWFLLVPLVILFWIFNQGIALIFARLTVHFRDLSQFIPFISRMVFYTSGVFFDARTVVKGHPILESFVTWQPLIEVLSLARGILMTEYAIHWDYWWKLALWAFGMLIVGVVFFWQAEERYGRED